MACAVVSCRANGSYIVCNGYGGESLDYH